MIQAGSVVELKSGGPNMTVKWVENGYAYCEWFNKDLKVEGEKFAVAQLVSKD